jgi:hypothetical protein
MTIVGPSVLHRFAEEALGFFCPEACFQVVSSPYCVIKVLGRPAVPCRVGLSAREAEAAAAQAAGTQAASDPAAAAAEPVRIVMDAGAPLCRASDDPDRRNGGDLVRRPSSPRQTKNRPTKKYPNRKK